MKTPDFAYPKTVVKDAGKALDKALKNNNPVEALRAYMDLTLASGLISRESIPPLIARLDSMALSFEAPYSGIAYLLEADIYHDIFNRERYSIENRVVAEDVDELNPQFWDTRLFTEKIDSLINLALSERKEAETIPLKNIASLVDSAGSLEGFTLYDFFVYKAISLYLAPREEAEIPFFKPKGKTFRPVQLIDELLSLHSDQSSARLTAILKKCEMLPEPTAAAFLWEEILKCGNDPFCVPLLTYYYQNYLNQDDYDEEDIVKHRIAPAEFYAYVGERKKALGNGADSKQLSGIIDQMKRQSVVLNYRNPSHTGKIEIEAHSINCADFFVLLLKRKGNGDTYVNTENVSALMSKISAQRVSIGKGGLFTDTVNLEFQAPSPGRYAVIASRSESIADIIKDGYRSGMSMFEVSDIDIITFGQSTCRSAGSETEKKPYLNGCFVVNSADGAPVEGAEVTFKQLYSRETDTKSKTDSNGYAATEIDRASITASFNGSKAEASVYMDNLRNNVDSNVSFLVDRAVYRPGDMVKFMGLCYSNDNNSASILADTTVIVELKNANWEVVDSLTLQSDSSGRIFGEFTLPADGLLGRWILYTKNGQLSFKVAEYKTPSMLVTLEKGDSTKDSIEFKGLASTYSGMPLPDCPVTLKINYSPHYFFFYRGERNRESFSTELSTDANGEFKISLPLGNLKPEDYRGFFIVTAEVTDKAGETAISNNVSFWLKDSFTLSASIPDKICLEGEQIQLNVSVKDALDMPVVKEVEYTVKNTGGETVLEGRFESPVFTFNPAGWPSGKYQFEFSLPDTDSKTVKATTVLYRKNETRPPVESVIWMPEEDVKIPEGLDEIKLGFCSSYIGQYLLCVISDSDGRESYQWLKEEGNGLSVTVKTPEARHRTFVTVVAYRDHTYHSHTVTLIPAEQKKRLEIKTESFRNSINPGEEEEWKFTLSYAGEPMEGYAYALLYDSALDAIAPLSWPSTFFYPRYYQWGRLGGNSCFRNSTSFYGPGGRISGIEPKSFNFNTYDMNFYGDYGYFRRGSIRGSRATLMYSQATGTFELCEEEPPMMKMGAMNAMDDYAVFAEEEASVFEERTDGDAAETGGMSSDVEFRELEMPVAFFRPDLATSADGELLISFTVPNFNTTWNFLLGAYTPELQSALISKKTVASKKVMVKMLPPRFLRTGDEARITATLYNNSDTAMEIYGVFEIFNPLTGEVLKSCQSNAELVPPSGNRVIFIEYSCPSDLSTLGLRVYAKGAGHSDGEQTAIPVLPSSQPVVESDPFYLAPGQEEFKMSFPEYKNDASLTFKYCDNPLWEVVTALPAIVNLDSESLTANVCALYANCVGHGIFQNNPSLLKGLQMIVSGQADDALLISKLQQDAQLKTVTLNNTPWVNNAAAETLRLSKLGTLLDSEEANNAIQTAWEKILSLRSPEGGWSWCKGMKSSPWMTQMVLINLGLLRQGNYLPGLKDLGNVIPDAIRFVDKDYVNEYYKLDKSNREWLLASMLQYLYIRSFFPEVKADSRFADIRDKALKLLDKNWETLSIFDKATAAITLWRYGRRMTAREILLSLKEFSSESPVKGVWFDNLDSSWQGAGKQLTTARVLMAFNEISPSDSIIDGMRQWMLLQRQTQDWQEGLWSIDAIDAILTTGSKWDGEYQAPEITVGDSKVPLDQVAALTGAVTISLDKDQLKKKGIDIRRFSLTPAWGGVISQYVAPMLEVKADTIPDLAVRKEVWKIEEAPGGSRAVNCDSFKVGDRVRVTLLIDCGRDMDYVALTDERAACLEPVDQLSGYDCIDGLWCYHETRNKSTNIFFDFLPRGRHVVTYDCFVMEEGIFAMGIATLQCQYSPLMTAHSAGKQIIVK